MRRRHFWGRLGSIVQIRQALHRGSTPCPTPSLPLTLPTQHVWFSPASQREDTCTPAHLLDTPAPEQHFGTACLLPCAGMHAPGKLHVCIFPGKTWTPLSGFTLFCRTWGSDPPHSPLSPSCLGLPAGPGKGQQHGKKAAREKRGMKRQPSLPIALF